MSSESITTVATVVLAAVGIATFGATWRLARQTKGLAGSTRDLAAETKRDADASFAMVSQAKRDRELAIEPHLVFNTTLSLSQILEGEMHDGTLHVANIGKGPALLARYWAFASHPEAKHRAYFETGPFALGAASRNHFPVRETNDGAAMLALGALIQGTFAGLTEVIVCVDQFKNYYRFIQGQAVAQKVSASESSGTRPEWTTLLDSPQQPADF